MKFGYHQVKMAEQNKEMTVFFYGHGLWQFKVMAFDPCNAPVTFKRLMERVMDKLQWKRA